MRIVGVNGIASHGKENIDVLLHYMRARGFQTVDVPLPKRHFISAWWGHKADAIEIADHSEDGDIVVCHSFGGPRTAEAMRVRDYAAVIFIRPAMDKHHDFSEHKSTELYCIHSPDDWPVRIGSRIPWHPFGRAGVEGFDSELVTNRESGGGHNADFGKHIHFTADFVADIASRLQQRG